MDFTDAHKAKNKLKPSLTIHGTLFDAFIHETDLDVDYCEDCMWLNGMWNPTVCPPSRVRF